MKTLFYWALTENGTLYIRSTWGWERAALAGAAIMRSSPLTSMAQLIEYPLDPDHIEFDSKCIEMWWGKCEVETIERIAQ